MTDGYIYCFSNPSMPGILKVGMTERIPEARLSEANASDTWRPPTPYKIEFAKKVSNPSQKENTLHTLLEKYTDRIHPRREFFRVSPEEVLKFFDLMDGEMWAENRYDIYSQFVDDSIISDKAGQINFSDLYLRFKEWYRESVPNKMVPMKSEVKEYYTKLWGEPQKEEMSENVWKGRRVITIEDEVDKGDVIALAF